MPQWVSASQLNQWAYCSRQYWLAQVVGLAPDRGTRERFRRGTRRHQRHGRLASGARRLARTALWLGALALLGAAVLLLAGAAPAPDASVGTVWREGWVEARALLAGAERALQSALQAALGPLDALGASTPGAWVALAGLGTLALVALLLHWFAGRLQARTGLPDHQEIIASDTGQNRVALLRHWRHGLVGKPDYVLRRRTLLGSRLFAVELKPTRRSTRLQPGDELQALAYALLLRGEHGRRAARYAYVVYAEHSFRVELTRAKRRLLLRTARAIRRARGSRNVARNHGDRVRCARCPFRTQCGESLAR